MAKDAYKYFRVEARELLEQLGQGALDLEKGVAVRSLVAQLLRLAHTLKGAARVVKQPEIADSAHRIEDALTPWRETDEAVPRACIDTVLARLDQIGAALATLAPAANARSAGASAVPPEGAQRRLRADVAEMDALLDGVAQTHAQVALLRRSCSAAVGVRTLAQRLQVQLVSQRGRDGARSGSDATTRQVQDVSEELQSAIGSLESDLNAAAQQIDRELRQLREAAEQLRLIPASALFGTLERTARDVAQGLGKQVVFEGRGGDVRLDAHVLDVVQGALLQLVRNGVAHGIEAPGGRLAAGKPPVGRVTLEVLRLRRQVAFRCVDDGAGIDFDAVRRSVQRKGLLNTSTAQLGTDALLQLLKRGGVSTSSAVTELAGRGIGLDVARDTAERLGGELSIRTSAGQGTTLELLVPLSLASVEALLVEAAGSVVAIPLDALRCTVRVAVQDIARSAQGDTLVHKGQAIPYVALSQLLDGAMPPSTHRHVSALIVEHEGVLAALGVERLQAMVTIVLSPLPELAPANALVAGVTVDVDGTPQLVLNAEALVRAAQRATAPAPAVSAPPPVLVVDDSLTTRMLEQSILESAGYAVHAAVSGEEALERAHRQPYALFLVDVEMPGMDGFTFVERTRADPVLREVPAMLITSRGSPADRRRGLEAGAQAYIVKSEFAQAEFLERVRELVG